jgi:aldose 1-epimerase
MTTSIDPRAFHRSDARGDVRLHTLRSENGTEISVCNYGATLVEWLAPIGDDRRSIILGYASLAAYENDPSYQGCVPGRCANRLGHARFELLGTAYQLPPNDGAHALHGGAEGFSRQVWEMHPEPAHPDGDSVRLTLESPDGDAGYPGNLTVSVRYTLTPDGHLRITYNAATDAPTIVNLTNHAYFNLDDAGSIEHHQLQTPAQHIVAVDDAGIPTGEIVDTAGTPFDFSTLSAFAPRLATDHPQLAAVGGIDHHFILGDRSSAPRFAARLASTDAAIEMWTTEPGFQVYTGNDLQLTPDGRRGRGWHPREGVCLEAQIHPDAINHPHFPSPVITPETPYGQVTEYRWFS